MGILASRGGSQRVRPRRPPQPWSHLLHGHCRPAALHDPGNQVMVMIVMVMVMVMVGGDYGDDD